MNGSGAVLVAALLHLPNRRLRQLAMGADDDLAAWLNDATTPQVVRARRRAQEVTKRMEALRARLLVLCDVEYPPALRELADPPAFLVAFGGTIAFGGTAIVGSRTPSMAGARMSRALAARVAAPIVSGLALGIDEAAHRGALAASRLTIAYVGHGFGNTYPPEHRALEQAIVAAGGTILSERLPDEPATRWSLVRRDRLQAAHAACTVLVESERSGGAMHTLRFAAGLGRRRFAFDPKRGARNTEGNAAAIARGARSLPWDVDAAVKILAATA